MKGTFRRLFCTALLSGLAVTANAAVIDVSFTNTSDSFEVEGSINHEQFLR